MAGDPPKSPNAEDYVHTAAKILSKKGQKQELEILLNSEASMSWYNNDWDISEYILYLKLPFNIYNQIMDTKSEYEDVIEAQVNELAEAYKESVKVKLVPIPESEVNWRKNFTTLSQSTFGIPPRHSQYEADIFMIMPFDETALEEVFENHITKVTKQLGMTIKRGDNFFTNQAIITDIWAALNSAKLIIAECTGRNTNVFYELGIAHTLGRPAIPITQKEADIPFDIRHWRYIKYEFTPSGMSKFEQNLSQAIQKILGQETNNGFDIPF